MGHRPSPLAEVTLLFLRLGLTAFGGPAAHIAIIEEECVRRRRWMTREEFLQLLAAANLIPGPTSTELAMHVGLRRAGWAGLVAAGLAFILPPAVIVGMLAAVYVQAGELPAIEGVLRAVKPVVVVVVALALLGLARTALRSVPIALLAAAAALLALAGLTEVRVLLLAGFVHAAVGWRRHAVAVAAAALPATLLAAAGPVAMPSLFLYFLKAGSVIFGSGYVLFAVIQGDLVEGSRWLTEAQLIDAIAVGQVTPGPVFTSATFIGYLLGGAPGAVAATVGVFLPAFLFTAASARMLERLRTSAVARAFLEGVSAAAVALIAVVLLQLAGHAIVDWPTGLIAAAATLLLGWARAGSAWVLAAAAVLGLAIQAF